jgi:hypothetical protein
MGLNKAKIGFSSTATPFPNATGLITERNCDQPLISITAVEPRSVDHLGLSSMKQPSPNGRYDNYERSFCLKGQFEYLPFDASFELADYSGGEECSLVPGLVRPSISWEY